MCTNLNAVKPGNTGGGSITVPLTSCLIKADNNAWLGTTHRYYLYVYGTTIEIFTTISMGTTSFHGIPVHGALIHGVSLHGMHLIRVCSWNLFVHGMILSLTLRSSPLRLLNYGL